jgi:hypothetical protein
MIDNTQTITDEFMKEGMSKSKTNSLVLLKHGQKRINGNGKNGKRRKQK